MNRVCLYGIISSEPKFKELKGNNGKDYLRCNFMLSVNRGFKKPGDEYSRRDFIPVVLWGATARYVKKFLKKFDLCWVDGEFHADELYDKTGNRRVFYYCCVAKIGHGGVRFREVEEKAQEYYNKQVKEEQERLEKQQRAEAKAARKQAKLEDEAICPDWDELNW